MDRAAKQIGDGIEREPRSPHASNSLIRHLLWLIAILLVALVMVVIVARRPSDAGSKLSYLQPGESAVVTRLTPDRWYRCRGDAPCVDVTDEIASTTKEEVQR